MRRQIVKRRQRKRREATEAASKHRVCAINDRLIVRPRPLLVERLEIVSGLIYRAAAETDRAD